MNKNSKNLRPFQSLDDKQMRKQRSEEPQKNRPNETPWRNVQKSDLPDYDDEPGQMQQIEDSVKNGEYTPSAKVKRTTTGE